MDAIRYGMLGGATGGFIGSVHRMAMRLDGDYELVCGCFSRDADRSSQTAADLRLNKRRVYPDYASMIAGEAALPPSERMQLLVIVTPNDHHYAPAAAAGKAGFHVACEKPMTLSSSEARDLQRIYAASGKAFMVTHTYAGYPMVREARALVRAGKLGVIRKVAIEYPQGWLSQPIETQTPVWRLQPEHAGIACAMADIGTHAAHLLNFITGLRIEELSGDLNAFGEDRLLDDDGSALLRMERGVRGFLSASQIATGDENELQFRISGTLASIRWLQSEPNSLYFLPLDGPMQVLRSGNSYLSEAARRHCRLPAGHPEGYIEAFANLYRNLAFDIRYRDGLAPAFDDTLYDYPGIDDGLAGMEFVEAVVQSSAGNASWQSPSPNRDPLQETDR